MLFIKTEIDVISLKLAVSLLIALVVLVAAADGVVVVVVAYNLL